MTDIATNPAAPPAPRTAVDVFTRAAADVERKGLWKYVDGLSWVDLDESGRTCFIYAVNCALAEEPFVLDLDYAVRRVISVMFTGEQDQYEEAAHLAVAWNDAPERTAAEVADWLRAAARIAADWQL